MPPGQVRNDLVALTGSRSRAAIIALLFGDDPRPRHKARIAAETGMSRGAVQRELGRLTAAGLITRGKAEGLTYERTERAEGYGRPYVADASTTVYPELRTMVAKTCGAAARIREELPEHACLVWITGAYALGRAGPRDALDVVVLGHPKQLIARRLEALAPTIRRRIKPVVIFPDEWVARLAKHEITVLRLRRGPKLWLRGDGVALYKIERHHREAKKLVEQVVASGLDLTDDWDEDWDPERPAIYR